MKGGINLVGLGLIHISREGRFQVPQILGVILQVLLLLYSSCLVKSKTSTSR